MHNVEQNKKGKIDFPNQRSVHRMQHGATLKWFQLREY